MKDSVDYEREVLCGSKVEDCRSRLCLYTGLCSYVIGG